MADGGGDMPEDSRAEVVLIVISLLLVLGTLFCSMRIYVRWFVTRSLGWDDGVAFVALVSS